MTNLNIYMFKRDVESFAQCLRVQTGTRRYRMIQSEDHIGDAEFGIYLIEGQEKPPRWLSFIENHVEAEAVAEIMNCSNSALILLGVEVSDGKRFFAISCGYGYTIIDKDKIEPNFGLKTTLNAVDPQKIRSVNSRSVGVQTFQKYEASNTATNWGEFGVDTESEIIRLISGVCDSESLGKRIDGSDNLHLRADITLPELPAKCNALYDVYNNGNYKQRGFDFIDFLRFETDPSVIDALDKLLVEAVVAKQDDLKISVAYPDQIDYERCGYYTIRGLGYSSEVDDIDLKSIYDYISDTQADIGTLKKIKIWGCESSTDTTPTTLAESLYSYLSFEVEHDQCVYVLVNGKWYCVNKDYLQQIEDTLDQLRQQYDSNPLKDWPKSPNSKGKMIHDEGFYNKQYEAETDYLFLDKALYHRGYDKIEVADFFYKPERKLYCVKKLNRSSTLSHLFGQASVSADLFKGLPEYQNKFLNQLQVKWNAETFDSSYLQQLTFVYAIGTDKTDDLLEQLPLFSKINLIKHMRIITKMGYSVRLASIPLV